MRHPTTLLLALATLSASAQIGRKELRTDSGLVVLHHFRNGTLSTTEWRDRDDRFGRSIAYDQAGREIFSSHTRRVGGHARARFSYHANGGVSKVEVSDAPDGGIQWYRSTTTFDEQGNRTGFREDGRDDDGPLNSPGRMVLREPSTAEVPLQAPPAVVECQRLFVNEVHVVNSSGFSVVIKVEPKSPSHALQASQFVLEPGKTSLIGQYTEGETFASPVQRMSIVGTMTTKRGKQKQVGVLMMEERSIDKERKAWIYHVMPTGGRIGFGIR